MVVVVVVVGLFLPHEADRLLMITKSISERNQNHVLIPASSVPLVPLWVFPLLLSFAIP